MSPLQSLLLGVLQGLGEFLPISSSAHLILVPWLLGWPEHTLAFDVALHVGTLLAVLIAFAGDWVRLFRGAKDALLHKKPNTEARLLGLLVLATLPGGIAGLLLEKRAETTFRSPVLIAIALAILGIVLFFADRRGTGASSLASMTVADALLIGFSQAFAVIPGVSRSGITISTALFLKYSREESARFSFLLSTPIILGAALLKVRHLFEGGSSVLLGVIASAVVGLLAIELLLRYVRTKTYVPFAVYRVLVALFVIAVAFSRAS